MYEQILMIPLYRINRETKCPRKQTKIILYIIQGHFRFRRTYQTYPRFATLDFSSRLVITRLRPLALQWHLAPSQAEAQ